ncbi:MAG: transcriptional repressor [Eubacterium sp.]|nr:transcriptional repressor [Eubacterium sp.]
MLKYSKQREAIKNYLLVHRTHPTAETVYTALKDEFPNISLGTVYRNLSLLADIGEIQKLHIDNGADRFDGNLSPHYHAICKTCGKVDDIPLENTDFINQLAGIHYDGTVQEHRIYFYGQCSECSKNNF